MLTKYQDALNAELACLGELENIYERYAQLRADVESIKAEFKTLESQKVVLMIKGYTSKQIEECRQNEKDIARCKALIDNMQQQVKAVEFVSNPSNIPVVRQFLKMDLDVDIKARKAFLKEHPYLQYVSTPMIGIILCDMI